MNSACNVVGQCSYPEQYCHAGFCFHKGLLPPTQSELLGIFCISVLSGLGAVSGQGGSTPMPLLVYLMHYDPKPAKFVIFVIILASQTGSLFLHLLEHRTSVHTRLSYLVLPGMVAAATLGGIINAIMPEGLWMIALVTISLLQLTKIYKGARFAFKLETELIKRQVNLDLQPEEQDGFQLNYLARALLLGLAVLMVQQLTGSASFSSWVGVLYCSTYYWVILITIVVLLELLASHIIEQDEIYSGMASNMLLKANLAGLFAASEGQPGGIFLTPLFNQLGLSSRQSSATCNLTLSIVAAINSWQALAYGALRPGQFAELYLIIGLGSSIVSVGVYYSLKHFKRFSLLRFVQLSLVVITIICATSIGMSHWAAYGSEMFFWTFRDICPHR